MSDSSQPDASQQNNVDILWGLIKDTKVPKRDYTTLAAKLNALLAPTEARRQLVLCHVPRHLFEVNKESIRQSDNPTVHY